MPVDMKRHIVGNEPHPEYSFQEQQPWNKGIGRELRDKVGARDVKMEDYKENQPVKPDVDEELANASSGFLQKFNELSDLNPDLSKDAIYNMTNQSYDIQIGGSDLDAIRARLKSYNDRMGDEEAELYRMGDF